MKKFFRLADFGAVFATRAKGAEIGDKVSQVLTSSNAKGTSVIDFHGVEALSYSFVDEMFKRILEVSQRNENVGKSILVVGWSEDLMTILDKTLTRRNYNLVSTHRNIGGERAERILRCVT